MILLLTYQGPGWIKVEKQQKNCYKLGALGYITIKWNFSELYPLKIQRLKYFNLHQGHINLNNKIILLNFIS